MAEQDLERLLGGYATGTLTEEERRALFEAALHDQRLFDALADEEALRQVLDDPAVRRRVLAVLGQAEPRSASTWTGWLAGWLRQPRAWAVAGGLAVAVLAVTTMTRVLDQVTPLAGRQGAMTEEATPGLGAVQTPAPATVPEADADAHTDQAGDRLAKSPADQVQPSAAAPTARQKPGRQMASAEDAPTPAEPLAKEAKSVRPPVADVSGFGAPQLEERVAPRPSLPSTSQGRRREPESFRLPGMKTGNARELFYGSGTATKLPEAGKPSSSVGHRQDAPRSAEAFKKERFSEARSVPEPGGAVAPEDRTVLGLRYRILKRGPDGVFASADPDRPFAAHDAVRLVLEVNVPGHLYVLREDAPGSWSLVYPSHVSPATDADRVTRVRPGGQYTLPPAGVFELEGPARRSRFLVVFAREPEAGLRPYLLPRPPGDASPGGGALTPTALTRDLSASGESPTLIVERATEPLGSGAEDRAVYVVNPSPERRARIIAEITLSY